MQTTVGAAIGASEHRTTRPLTDPPGPGSRRLWTFLLAATALLFGACSAPKQPEFHFTQFAMGTVVEYTILADSPTAAREAMLAAQREIERVAALLWEEDPRSELSDDAAAKPTLSAETFSFLQRAYRYVELTSGAFDPTIKPVLDLYPFDADHPVPPSDAAVRAATEAVGMQAPEAGMRPVPVAVGGIAKGYAVDRAIGVLREYGVEHALVNAGGDLYALGSRNGRPWRVGIRDPREPEELIASIELTDRAVATSGDYERFFIADGVRYHHILDPDTGKPAYRSQSATVVAPSAEEADALATGFFVMGPEDALSLAIELPAIEAFVVDADGRQTATDGFFRPRSASLRRTTTAGPSDTR